MKALFISVCLLIAAALQAQNYEGFKTQTDYFFLINAYDYLAFRIDSIHYTDTSTIMYPSRQLRRDTESECYTDNGASIVGYSVEVLNDGTHIFRNETDEPLYIKNNAPLNEKWVFHSFDSGDYFEAEVTEIDTLTYLGITDSVKHIKLRMFDSEHQQKNSTLNDIEIVITKYNGFFRIFDFYNFPDLDYLYSYTTASLPSGESSFRNITARDIFGFNVGDEFHTEYLNLLNMPAQNETCDRKIKRIISKRISENSDTLIYRIARIRNYYYKEWEDGVWLLKSEEINNDFSKGYKIIKH